MASPSLVTPGGGGIAACQGNAPYASQGAFCGFAMPPYAPAPCMPSVNPGGLLVSGPCGQLGIQPPPHVYPMAPPPGLPYRATEIIPTLPQAGVPLPTAPGPDTPTHAVPVVLVPREDIILPSAPSGASATARKHVSLPASGTPPDASTPLGPRLLSSKVGPVSPPTLEIGTDGSSAESKALSPCAPSVGRPGTQLMERHGSDTSDQEPQARVGGSAGRSAAGAPLDWGSSGRDGSDTSEDVVSYRVTGGVDATPRMYRRPPQQGPASDRTAQHIGECALARGAAQEVPRAQPSNLGVDGLEVLVFKPESHSSTGSDGAVPSHGRSVGSGPPSSARMDALLRAASNDDDDDDGQGPHALHKPSARAAPTVAHAVVRDEPAQPSPVQPAGPPDSHPCAHFVKVKRARSGPGGSDQRLLRSLRTAVSSGQPQAVKGVLGEPLFNHLRSLMLKQQDEHCQQVLELHRIVDTQRQLWAEVAEKETKACGGPTGDEPPTKQPCTSKGQGDQDARAVPAHPAQVSAPYDASPPLGLAALPGVAFPPNLDPMMAALMSMGPMGPAPGPGMGCPPRPTVVSGPLGMCSMPNMCPPGWMPGMGMPGMPLGPLQPSCPPMGGPLPGWGLPQPDMAGLIGPFPPGFQDGSVALPFGMPHSNPHAGMGPLQLDANWQRMQMPNGNGAGFPRMTGPPPPNFGPMRNAATQSNYGAWMDANQNMHNMIQMNMAAQLQQHQLATLQAAAPGQSSSVTQDNETGHGYGEQSRKRSGHVTSGAGEKHKKPRIQLAPAAS